MALNLVKAGTLDVCQSLYDEVEAVGLKSAEIIAAIRSEEQRSAAVV